MSASDLEHITLRKVRFRTGIVLAAGRGKRLSPMTDMVPKPLLKYRGKTFLEHSLDALEYAKVDRVVIVIGHLGEQIRSFVASRNFNFQIEFAYQATQLGSADAMGKALSVLDVTKDQNLVVVASDYVTPRKLIREMFATHEVQDVSGTVLTSIARDEAASKSSIVFWNAGLISQIQEKPKSIIRGKDYEVCKLCYVFSGGLMYDLSAGQIIVGREESIPDRINFAIRNGAKFSSLFARVLLDAEEVLL